MIRKLYVMLPFLIVCAPIHSKEKEWYCFRHKTEDALRLKCYEYKPPNKYYPEIHCYYPGKKDWDKFTPDEKWEKLKRSHPTCADKCKELPPIPKGD